MRNSDTSAAQNPSWILFSRDYDKITAELSRLTSQIPDKSGDDRRRVVIGAEDCVTEAEIMLRAFSTDIRSWSRADRLEIERQLEMRRADLSDMRRELNRSKRIQKSTRGGTPAQTDQRARVIELHSANEGLNDSLLRSKQQLAESHEIGVGVSVQLKGQREQMEGMKYDIAETQDTMARARRVLVRMARRVITDKIIQAAIVLIELAIIGFLVWYKLLR
eukprot:276577_1